MDSRFNFRGSGKQGTCFQICLKQLRKALEIQGAISDFNLFWTAVNQNTKNEPKKHSQYFHHHNPLENLILNLYQLTKAEAQMEIFTL